MVDTKELMIGNWVTYEGELVKVVGMIEERVAVRPGDSDKMRYSLKGRNLEPVRLDDHVMAKCGFVKNSHLWVINDALILEPFRSAYSLSYFGQRIEGLKYLHQLQNAYFMLTGKQL